MNSNGTAAIAARWSRVEEQVLDLLAACLEAHPAGERRCRSSARGCPSRRCTARRSRGSARRTPRGRRPTQTGTVAATSKRQFRAPPRAFARAARCSPAARRRTRARRRWRASRPRSRRRARGCADRPPRGRSGTCCRERGARSSLSALPGPSGSGSVKNSPSYRTGLAAQRHRLTMSTYSRVRASGLANRTPCQPSDTCGPETPRPSRNRPPLSRSRVAAVIAVMAGRAGRDLHDGGADVDPLGLGGEVAEHASASPSRTPRRPRRPCTRASSAACAQRHVLGDVAADDVPQVHVRASRRRPYRAE